MRWRELALGLALALGACASEGPVASEMAQPQAVAAQPVSQSLSLTRADAEGPTCPFTARRLANTPIITHDMDPGLIAEAEAFGYVNINGPSLVAAPPWDRDRLGQYYLYFAHHRGRSIRMAYADALAGPWRIHPPGVLAIDETFFPTETLSDLLSTAAEAAAALKAIDPLEAIRVWVPPRAQTPPDEDPIAVRNPHIASPDVHVDADAQQVRMYFHGARRRDQRTRVALSSDGLDFAVQPAVLTGPYLRVFQYRDRVYGIARPGTLYRSRDGISRFRSRQAPLLGEDVRHTAVLRRGEMLYIFYSRIGDAPERIVCAAVDLSSQDWNDWRVGRSRTILRPDLEWEGRDVRRRPSVGGPTRKRRRELRDPAIFEENGRLYLIYAGAGEQALGIAELIAR